MFGLISFGEHKQLKEDLKKAERKTHNLIEQIQSDKNNLKLHELENFVLESCHSVTFNLNDTFAYAGADSEDIDVSDLQIMSPLMEIYGGNDVALAYCCLVRGMYPISGDNKRIQMIIDKLVEIGKNNEFFLTDRVVSNELSGDFDFNFRTR